MNHWLHGSLDYHNRLWIISGVFLFLDKNLKDNGQLGLNDFSFTEDMILFF